MFVRKSFFLCLLLALLATCPSWAQTPTMSYSPSSGLMWPRYERDDTGTPVRTIQLLLRSRGYRVGVDGSMGTQTINAVKKFQKARKLKVDGLVGWQTWEALVPQTRQGARGDVARAIQELLRWQGRQLIRVDGRFGRETTIAVKGFQHGEGLTQDGVVGRVTWCHLVGGKIGGDE